MSDMNVNGQPQQPVNIRPDANQGVDGETVNQQGTAATSSVERREIDQDAIENADELINEYRQTIAAMRTALRGTLVDEAGNPTLADPASGSDIIARVPKDIEGNSYFEGSGLLNLRLSLLEQQKTNRETALEFGLMEAELMLLWKELKQEEAKLTKESYLEQAKMAMMEVIGAAVSMGMSVASLAGMTATMGVGAARGAAQTRTTGSTSSPGGKVTTTTYQKGFTGRSQGAFSAGSAYSMGVGGSINQMSGSAGQIISGVGRMEGNENLAQIESLKLLIQATAEQVRKAQDTLEKGANDALEQNDRARQMLKQVNEEFARLFGSVTPH